MNTMSKMLYKKLHRCERSFGSDYDISVWSDAMEKTVDDFNETNDTNFEHRIIQTFLESSLVRGFRMEAVRGFRMEANKE